MSVVLVELLQHMEHHIGGIPGVGVFQRQQICVVEDHVDLVLEGCVEGLSLVVELSCLIVLVNDPILITWCCPCWPGGCAAWARRELEYCCCEEGLLARRKDETKVSVLSSAKHILR